MKKISKKSSVSPTTVEQKRELAALAALSDDSIDFSDIPPLTEKFWQNAVRNPFIGRLSGSLQFVWTRM